MQTQTLFFREYEKQLNEWGFEATADNSVFYKIEKNTITFKVCGFLTIDRYLICVFPKGFSVDNKSIKILEENAQLLIQVLNKYDKKSIKNKLISDEKIEKNNNDYIALANEIAKDYIHKNLITQSSKKSSVNGSGKTNWGKTLKKTTPEYINNNYMYMNLVNEKTLTAMSSEIQQIHWFILKDIEEKIGWLIHFKVKPIHTMRKRLNIVRAKNVLKKMLNMTYNQESIRRLNLLHRYLNNNFYGNYLMNPSFKLFYTFNFETVWEKICKVIYQDEQVLHELVPKYLWTKDDKVFQSTNIIPDILTHMNNHTIAILDAKYYPELQHASKENKLPPSGDISKQLIYRKVLSFEPLFQSMQLMNVFILPGVVNTDGSSQEIGKLSFAHQALKNDLHEIYAIQIDAEQAMRDYLEESIEFKSALHTLLLD